MYKNILIPIDGSEKALQAARHGANLASRIGARVTLFNVTPVMPADVRGMVLNKINAQGRETLEKVAAELTSYNVQVETEMIMGHPAEAICKKAKTGRYDLIIMGSRGLSGVKGYLMGSVSIAVTTHASCPVLIVR
ncbi:putative universal stress protein [Pelotomaculum propionicicum]|uniref:Putative universal stress protein n=1 Tax=Pelotomaculum propionicicum TaxID=258475 RepID=A0A4Y7RUR4_9FIRM|nr:universal stress protein [Peptococcaceae bacterium]TEB12496.1 putative universal stress protein [Pelotomaculum propionicicum]